MKTAFCIRILCAGLLAFLAACTSATSADPVYTVSATMPTEYTSGAALPLSDIASMTVTYTVNGGALQSKTVTTLQATTITTVPKQLGTTCFQVYVTTKATAAGPNASSSMTPEPPVCLLMAGIPRAPSNVQVTP